MRFKGVQGQFAIHDGQGGFYCADGFIALRSVFNTSLEQISIVEDFSGQNFMKIPDRGYLQKASSFFTKIAPF